MSQEPDLLKMLAVAENAGEAWADGEHIDIFTPTRVRLLIERVVRAEAIVNQLTPTHLKMIRHALDGDGRG